MHVEIKKYEGIQEVFKVLADLDDVINERMPGQHLMLPITFSDEGHVGVLFPPHYTHEKKLRILTAIQAALPAIANSYKQ
jgi:hypothetical protein